MGCGGSKKGADEVSRAGGAAAGVGRDPAIPRVSRLGLATAEVFPYGFNQAELEGFLDEFREIDSGGDGNEMITVLEMARWLREAGHDWGAQHSVISMVFFLYTIDADATRQIGFREYVRFKRYAEKQKAFKEEQRRALLFDFADKTFSRFSIDGRISDGEMPRLFEVALGMVVPKHEMEAVLTKFDENKDGFMDREEFMKFVEWTLTKSALANS